MNFPNQKQGSQSGSQDPLVTEFKALKSKMKMEGFFEANPSLVIHQSLQALFLLVGCVGLSSLPHWMGGLVGSVCLALYYCLCAYIAHDVAHGQTSRSKKMIELSFLALSLAQGLSLQWWRRKHSIHHAHTNVFKIVNGEPVPVDGDIATAPLFFWSKKLLKSNESLWVKVWLKLQPYAIWPLMPILRFQWIWHSLVHGSMKERGLIALHTVGLLALLSYISPWGILGAAAIYITANIISGSILCSFFLFGHSGMLVRDQAQTMDEFREQVRTTRNFSGTRWMTWLSGGLNYQIEHHLFPALPREKLPLVAPWIEELAKKYDEPYGSDSVLESYKRVFESLKM